MDSFAVIATFFSTVAAQAEDTTMEQPPTNEEGSGNGGGADHAFDCMTTHDNDRIIIITPAFDILWMFMSFLPPMGQVESHR
ncbi:hypothetical protein PC9H_008751 [Pleurotus ostreatus]|uniref:Uncharacterized protein n=1 Tax=Pleurotus ostreatus TaxID=5322 RepID=A0A8H6ZPD5_PLEOS|nr:uncharacterized protein PC9H_008751 [Pleurotus ostreatus]KAF7426383.1 hypothetical protein PC9H_008751 [Pleurotus ostreatus]